MMTGRALLAALLASARRAEAAPGTATCPLSPRQCAGAQTEEKFIAAVTDPDVYNRAVSPNQACGLSDPVKVETQFLMTHLDNVNQILGQVTVGTYFRQYWKDPRLAFNSTANGGCFDKITLPPTFLPKYHVWTPNLYMDNGVSKSDDGSGSQLFEISPDGSIWWSQFALLTVASKMNFHRLPYDRHRITLVLASYSLDNSVVRLVAKGGTPGHAQSGVGIVSDPLISSTWNFEDMASEKEGISTAGLVETRFSGTWDYLTVHFTIARRTKFFIEQVVVQDFLFLGVCYAGFFVNPSNAPARAAMAVIPVLIMRTLVNFVMQGLPQLSYSVWLADYLMVSMWLCVFCVAQFAITQYLLLREGRGDVYYKKLKSTEQQMRKIVAEARHRGIKTLTLLDQLQPQDGPNDTRVSWRAQDHAVENMTAGNRDEERTEGAPRHRMPIEFGEHEISEANVCVLERAQLEFKRFDKDQNGCLAPDEIRRMLMTFNIYMSTADAAVAMCKFQRDRFLTSPKDPMKATLNLGEFVEFLYGIDDYVIAVPHRFSQPFSPALPKSRRWDIAAQWFFPVVVVLKIVFFFSIIHVYGETA